LFPSLEKGGDDVTHSLTGRALWQVCLADALVIYSIFTNKSLCKMLSRISSGLRVIQGNSNEL